MDLRALGIGGRLTLLSGVGVAVIGLSILVQSGFSVSMNRAIADGEREAEIARNLVDMKASMRGIEIGGQRMLLARSAKERDDAEAYLAKRLQSVKKYLGLAETVMVSDVDRQRAASLGPDLQRFHDLWASMADDAGAQPSRADDVTVLRDALAPRVDEAVDAAKQASAEAGRARDRIVGYMYLTNMITSALLIALMTGAALIGRRAIAQPIVRITGCMTALAEGDLARDIPYADKRDEIGQMARAVEVFRRNAIAVRDLNAREAALRVENADLQGNIAEVVAAAVAGDFTARIGRRYDDPDLARFASSVNDLVVSVDTGVAETNRVVAALAVGDLTAAMQGHFRGVFLELQTNVNATMERLRQVMAEVRSAIDMIEAGAGELRVASSDLARRTERQAASIEETAAALEEITAAVGESTRRSSDVAVLVANALSSADQSSDVVRSAVAAMGRIEHASGEISNIINVIDEIAFQTNLLALNAGVEAARAGESGKGFAVVAQEVRELAQRSAGAAKGIKELIIRSRSEVDQGVGLVTLAGGALDAIRTQVVDINGQVGAIAASASEQAAGLTQVNAAIGDMDQSTQKNAAMVEEAAAATSRLADEAVVLNRLLARFNTRADASRAGYGASRAA
ncbi:methyl-accepting chemotaxis protein [Rhizobium sp. SG_E_25_P2]|uniref:methyl-accepting chemotaxis protein n=1 Tax=Rhizobium sp. SG_E_25_P2 TaxID=2879942 RepID=UPI0024738131|nr:methyl-accepting chemotaxis protein [Rhizobium sp. SG_E_25_P2]MDH6269098.1 methyl-accepting chemotaxis protein [Rhizobium sp. SG_E_25_P2]